MEPSFQPTSTAVHVQHRYMVWNDVGIIRRSILKITIRHSDTRYTKKFHYGYTKKYSYFHTLIHFIIIIINK